MIFEEKAPSFALALLAPLLAFLIAFPLWHLAERDLFWNEGDYAVCAAEFNSFPPVVQMHGQVIRDEYPLFPLLASAVSKCGFSMEFSLRFISVLSLLGLVIIVWVTCYRAAGPQAAAVSGAMMLSTILVAEKAIEGYPQMFTVLLVFSGWLSWFNLGQGRGQWNLAWILAGLFAGLAFYSGGWQALIYFLVPLLFLRRPLAIWQKLSRWGFAVGAVVVLTFILFWLLPSWFQSMTNPQQPEPFYIASFGLLDYLEDFIRFPFDTALRFMPWTLFLWAPFCAALIPLDKNPLFSKYFRIITCVIFILMWLNPNTKGRDILYLAPMLAILTGQYYWIVVRRYGHKLLWLCRGAAYLIIVSAGIALAYLLIPPAAMESMLNTCASSAAKISSMLLRQDVMQIIPFLNRDMSFRFDSLYMVRSAAEVGAAILFGTASIFFCRKKSMIWINLLTLFCGVMLIFWAVVNPYRAADRTRSLLGRELRLALNEKMAAPDTVIYKDASISGLYAETFYMGYPVRALNSLREIPENARIVFLISTKPPAMTERNWTMLRALNYKGEKLFLWEGKLLEEYIYDDFE